MAWKQKITDMMADCLRFFIHGALLLNGILLSIASIYIVAKFCWFFVRWIDRIWFSSPW